MADVVSIILATRDRPELLRKALQSVRQQSARERVSQIIVSEGGSTLDSQETCAAYSDLPIAYFDHRPPMPAAERMRSFWAPVTSPLVALLHDDDWWAPDHLAAALRVFELRPDLSGVYSSYYSTFGPRYPFLVPDVSWFLWFCATCDFRQRVLFLNEIDVMLCCLLSTTLHFSTLVGRHEAMWDAYLKVFETENFFDGDRTFPVFLSSCGPIGYVAQPSVFVRIHAGMDSQSSHHAARLWHLMRDTTRWLLQTEPERVAAAVAKFNATVTPEKLEALPRLRRAISDRVHEPQWTTLIQECGLNLPPREQFVFTSRPERASLFEQWCPPVVFALQRRLKAMALALAAAITPTARGR